MCVCFLQVELLNFEGEVLTDDGGIIRRIKVKGESFNNPNEGSTVEGTGSSQGGLSLTVPYEVNSLNAPLQV